jgi:hypothetical protein
LSPIFWNLAVVKLSRFGPTVLWQMANEYQAKAARVEGGVPISRRDEIAIAL